MHKHVCQHLADWNVYVFLRKSHNRNNDGFRKIIIRYKISGYNMNVMRQTASLVVNPITVGNFVALFNCTPAGRASALMMAPV